MKILQFKSSASRGGAETMLLQLTSGLSGRGHQVTTVLGERGWLGDRLDENGFDCRTLPLTSWRGLLQIPRLIAMIRSEKPDLVLSHGARVNLFATLAAFFVGVPSFSVEHNVDGWRETSGLLNALDRLVAGRNRGRIAVSAAVGGMLVEKGIIAKKKVEVVYNGIDRSDSRPDMTRSRLRADYSMPAGAFVVVTVARLARQKGHQYLLESLAMLRREHPEVRCLLLGDGELSTDLHRLAESLGVDDIVVFAGAVDHVMSLLPACDLFVLPSLWEGLPVALIEAMFMGLPVVATEVAGTPEVVEHGKTGLLVRPANSEGLARAVSSLIVDEAFRLELAEAGKHHAETNFGMSQVVDRYEEVFERWLR